MDSFRTAKTPETKECPTPPASENDLEFTRQTMVAWYDPNHLIRTGIKVILSTIFGNYADRREIQAALKANEPFSYAEHDELWIDYMADMGDGWNSTYTMARLLAAKEIQIGDLCLPRANLLILGGDQVYPAAKIEEYRDRFIGPFSSALPCVVNEKNPDLFALPGNHDWYDGLTSFLRVFCQGNWIGGWKSHQSRSYFALQLPHNWWIWGIDTQLTVYFDKPQLDFFEKVAKQHMPPGSKIIMCAAEPVWSINNRAKTAMLAYLERHFITRYQHDLALTVAGDLHHYARYSSKEGKTKITSGGGGAFLHPTHVLPTVFNSPESGQEISYNLAKTFPDAKTSRRLARYNFIFPFINRKFGMTMGGFYLLFAWLLQSTSIWMGQPLNTQLPAIRPHEGWWKAFSDALHELSMVLAHSPFNVIFALILFTVLYFVADHRQRFIKLILGLVHTLAHLTVNLAAMWFFLWLNIDGLGLHWNSGTQITLFIAEMLFVGGFLGSIVVGLYLYFCVNWLNIHWKHAFSSLKIQDYKNYLRLHITAEGLTVYPVGVEEVVKNWRYRPAAKPGEPWFEPASRDAEPFIIEQPVFIPNKSSLS